MKFRPVVGPATNTAASTVELAASFAASEFWKEDVEDGSIFTAGGVRVAASVEALAVILSDLGWLIQGAAATGINWGQIPDDPSEMVAVVRRVAVRLGCYERGGSQ